MEKYAPQAGFQSLGKVPQDKKRETVALPEAQRSKKVVPNHAEKFRTYKALGIRKTCLWIVQEYSNNKSEEG